MSFPPTIQRLEPSHRASQDCRGARKSVLALCPEEKETGDNAAFLKECFTIVLLSAHFDVGHAGNDSHLSTSDYKHIPVSEI